VSFLQTSFLPAPTMSTLTVPPIVRWTSWVRNCRN